MSVLGARHQVSAMRHAWPGFKSERLMDGLVWRGWLRPKAWLDPFQVQVRLVLETRERRGAVSVNVVQPVLDVASSQRAECHMYSNGSLCLFDPSQHEWTPRMSVAETIVPWAAEWIYYFQIWQVTGAWLGGGGAPGSVAKGAVP